MTYCVGLLLERGLVFMSDTRTNAGVDNISTFRKAFTWEQEDDRLITILTSGNLGTSQAVISLLEERLKKPEKRAPSILQAPTMFRVAQIVGETLRETIRSSRPKSAADSTSFNATFILGGQIKGMEPKLFLIYPEGNFVEAGPDTPFFQAGETKYGRPILLRAFRQDMEFSDAIKLLMVSFDSTIKSNLSVGPPLDLLVHERDQFTPRHAQRVEQDDPVFTKIADAWSSALIQAFDLLPDSFMENGPQDKAAE